MSTSTKPTFDPATYRKPKSAIGAFVWRWKMWFEATFVFSMLEPWEKILLITIFGSLWILVTVGVYKYLPHHIMEMRERAAYYLLGKKSIAL